MTKIIILLLSFVAVIARSQDQVDIIDILDYAINLEVADGHDTILVHEKITTKLLQEVDSFYLDLHSLNDGQGMTINKVLININGQSSVANYSHYEDKLWIHSTSIPSGSEFSLDLVFFGIPATGLIVGENKFGQRTYFGDNWPNRAHHWFACVDHPSDKASVSFTVICPKKYNVVATGLILKDSSTLDKKIVYYKSNIELPTKVMVVGIAAFEKQLIDHNYSGLFQMTAWVYEEDKENGFRDMAVAKDVINYFVKVIGPYPFEKLDHVQSTTQFGGMENAGNIFYDENAVTGNETMEALIAHEVAHQWFGNSASEKDWPHLWLSEGFATYFTDLYWENKYGTEAMNERLIGERNRVIQFSKRYDHPLVDTTYESLMDLLNPNSYQKGAWFLHMLRNEIGDSVFWKGIQNYYTTYQFSNATTSDFRIIMETESKKDLRVFFDQWLKHALHPIIQIDRKSKGEENYLVIRQRQKTHLFTFKLDVKFIYEDNSSETITFAISGKKELFKIPSNKRIKDVIYDPNVKLLYELITN